MTRVIHDAQAVGDAVGRLADWAASQADEAGLHLVGMRTRGEPLARRIAEALAGRGLRCEVGILDVTLYRDDLTELGPAAVVRPTALPFDVDARPLLLVDDVLFTGRSVRAALGALADWGRPSRVRLAVLVDRGGRELPICPDFAGLGVDVPPGGRVNVRLDEVDGRDAVEVEG